MCLRPIATGEPGLSPAWDSGDSVEHTSVTSPWVEGSEEAGILIRQRVAGTGSQAALACSGDAGGCGQRLCLHLGPPDEWEPGP